MSRNREAKSLQRMDQEFMSRIGSYLPQWQIGPDSGETEEALLYAAWRLLEDTRGRMDRLPEKHEVEFLRVWGLEPAEAAPMSAYASLTAPAGEVVPAGTPLYLSGDGTRLWTTTHPVYAPSLTLDGQVLESGRLGKLLELPPPTPETPTRLFDFRAPGHQQRAARFVHQDAFRSQAGCTVRMSFRDSGPELGPLLADAARVRWSLESDSGDPLPVDPPRQEGGALSFVLPPAPLATALTAELLPGGAETSSPLCGGVFVSSRREGSYDAAVCDGTAAAEGPFHPFGLSPEPWRSCCLSCPDVLSLRGGWVSLSFTLSHTLREESLPGGDQPPEYRPVMRRLPPPPPQPREVCVQSTAWEYWNGGAWLPIPGAQAWYTAFAGADGEIRADFRWPPDAQLCQVGGQPGFWLRWRVTQADGWAYLPRRFHAPRVEGLRLSGCLENAPVEVWVCGGLTGRFRHWVPRAAAPLFPPLGPPEDGWWLRFDRAPPSDTLSLFAQLEGRAEGRGLTAWEDTPEGLRPLGLEDGTDGLGHSGLLLLSGIRGTETRRFGRLGWWLCFRNGDNTLSRGPRFPRLTGLYPGGVCLRARGRDTCLAGEPALPLRGGAVSGVTLTDGFGGAPPEQDRETLARARQRRHHLDRGVSPLDLQQLLRARFRDVARTRCLREGNRMLVAVLMRDADHHSAAFAQRREQLVRLLLEETALPTLGLAPEVREPRFYPIQVMAWLPPGCDLEEVRLALEAFLHPVTGGFRGEGWPMGDLPEETEVRNYLRDRLPRVKPIKLLLTAVTPRGLEADCAKVRDPFALPVSGSHSLREVKGEGWT